MSVSLVASRYRFSNDKARRLLGYSPRPFETTIQETIDGAWAGSIIELADGKLREWVLQHPLEDGKFAFFIFALIPVQTLFTYNWLILPQYLERAFEGARNLASDPGLVGGDDPGARFNAVLERIDRVESAFAGVQL